ncbi:MAG: hypothetical protein HYS25_13815 [Ignavibacteriales bacterium]|nr:hypothetical protein [Ignavibacteriales bacterium]
MQPNEIWKGIYDRLMGAVNEFKTEIGNELYFAQNPKSPNDVKYPYCVCLFVGGELSRDSMSKYEKPILRFVMYDNSVAQDKIFDVAEKLDNQLDDGEANIIMTGFEVLSVDRVTPLNDSVKDEIDNWRLAIDYRIHLQRL